MVANLETSILEIIQTALNDALTPVNATIENLAEKIVACEHYQKAQRNLRLYEPKLQSLKRK